MGFGCLGGRGDYRKTNARAAAERLRGLMLADSFELGAANYFPTVASIFCVVASAACRFDSASSQLCAFKALAASS